MSASADIQAGIIELLGQQGALRVPVPMVSRRPKDRENEILAAIALGNGLCGHVLPVLPQKVQDDVPFVFVDEGELRVRFIEEPAKNNTGTNAWQIADDTCNFLQGAPKMENTLLAPLLAHPLQLAPSCIETVQDERFRMVDVIFNAVHQLSAAPAPAVPFEADFPSVAEALQGALKAQLDGTLSAPTPVLIKQDHDYESRIATSGHPAKIELLPPMPARALQGVPFVFFEGYQVRARITEYPALNATGLDAYELVEETMTALHWQQFGGFLSHPLQLAERPIEMRDELDRREIDVIFNATLGFLPSET